MFSLELDRVPAVRALDLRGLSEMGVLSVDARTTYKIEFEEVLDAITQAAEEWSVEASLVRPCWALINRDGEVSGRADTAFNCALMLRHCDKNQEEVQAILYRWNAERLAAPLPASKIRSSVRNAFKERYVRPPSCKHPVLKAACIGDDCLTFKTAGLWASAPVTPTGVMASTLLPFINPLEWKAFCALVELSKRKGRGPDGRLHFTYREAERISGIRHQDQWRLWERLEALGLIEDFKPSPPQPKVKHRQVSSCRFPKQLPSAESMKAGLTQCKELRSKRTS
jgi:hypothetical protein